MWYLALLAAWLWSGIALFLLYLVILEQVEWRHALECADRYRILRLYRWIFTATGADKGDLMVMAIGPFPPLLGLLELLIRRVIRPAPSDHGLLT